MSQQFLKRKRVVPQLQVADGEGVAEDVRTDAFAGDPGPFVQAREEQGHAVFGERGARFRQEEVILARTAPLGQFLLVRPLFVQVVQEIAQAVLPQRDAPFFRPLALDREDTALAVKIRQAQPAQFRDADACVVEHPQDSAVAHRRPFGDRSGFVGRRAGHEELLEFLGVNGLDERLADFGEHHPVKGVALEHFAMYQPVEESTRRAGIGLDGTLATRLAAAPRARAHLGEPTADSRGVDLAHQGDAAFLLKIALQQPQRGAMPLQGLVAVVAPAWSCR